MPFRETLITMSSILWVHITHGVLQKKKERKETFSTKTDAGQGGHDDSEALSEEQCCDELDVAGCPIGIQERIVAKMKCTTNIFVWKYSPNVVDISSTNEFS